MLPGRVARLVAAGCLAAACLSLAAPPAHAQGSTVPVTIADELGEGQIDEVIAVWSGGRLLGTLHVTPARPQDSFTATLPPGPFTYALCGMLRRRAADGTVTNHPVDNAGRVPVQPGLTLRAFTFDDRLFALQAPGVTPEVGDAPACDAAIS